MAVNNALEEWVAKQRRDGFSDADLLDAAKKGGWGEKEINQFLSKKVQPKWYTWVRFVLLPVVLAIVGFLDRIIASQMNESGIELGAIGVAFALIFFLVLDAVGLILVALRRIGGYPLLIIVNLLKLLGIGSAVNFYFTGNSSVHTNWIYMVYFLMLILIVLLVVLARLESRNLTSSIVKMHQGKASIGFVRFRLSNVTSRLRLVIVTWSAVYVIFNVLIFLNTFSTTEYSDLNPALQFAAVSLTAVGLLIAFRLSIQIGVWVVVFGMCFMLFITGSISGIFTLLWLLLMVSTFVISKLCMKHLKV